MIRQAEPEDILRIKNLIDEYCLDHASTGLYSMIQGEDMCFEESILQQCIDSGFTFIAEKDESIVGIFLGAIVPIHFFDHILVAKEIIWYVMPAFRDGLIGYDLFKAFENEVQQRAENKDILCGLFQTMIGPEGEMERRGYHKVEQTFVIAPKEVLNGVA